MKKIASLVVAFTLLTSGLLHAQNKTFNDPNAESRQVQGFHGVKVSNGIELHITEGSSESVAVSASTEEYRSKIKTEVSNGVLKIYYDNNNWNNWSAKGKNLKAYVSYKQLDLLNASSGADIIAEGKLRSNSLSMDLSSGADFKGAVEAATMEIEVSSGADIDISGSVKDLKVSVSSGADFKGFDLMTETCKADASSGGGISVSVSKDLSADASSGGGIHYKGDATISRFSKSSGGSIKKV